jgi:hypothetical protein
MFASLCVHVPACVCVKYYSCKVRNRILIISFFFFLFFVCLLGFKVGAFNGVHDDILFNFFKRHAKCRIMYIVRCTIFKLQQ